MPDVNDSTPFALTKEEFYFILKPYLGSDLIIENFTTQSLTQPGENYGSSISAAELYIQQRNKKSILSLVVKLVPPSEFLRKSFDVEVTFNKEVNAYKLVFPEYEKLQLEKGISKDNFLDVFPKCYGSRTNRQNDSTKNADDSAIILFENLTKSGFVLGDRRKGLNLNHMEFAVSHLAKFHALGVALKMIKPEIFKENVLKACENCIIGGIADDNILEKWVTSTLEDIQTIPECLPYIDKIEKYIREDLHEKRFASLLPKEPFATFVHNDFWVNNMMFKYNTSNKENISKFDEPSEIKFVDFQITTYASPIKDLIFFIYSSSEDDVIENNCDDLIKLYHKEFINCLMHMGCDTKPFSYEHFQEEINVYAPKEFSHILIMTKFISADKSKVPNLSDCDAEVMLRSNFAGDLYKKRVQRFLGDFVKKGWL